MQEVFVLDTWKYKNHNLVGKPFEELIRLCFAHATHFSLTRSSAQQPSYPNAVEDLLEPYLEDSCRTRRWFGYSTSPAQLHLVYRAAPEAMEILLRCYQDLFLRSRRRVPKKKYEQVGTTFYYKSDLEDLCFFRGKELFFGTVSHEFVCAAYNIGAEFAQVLPQIADWECHQVQPEKWLGLVVAAVEGTPMRRPDKSELAAFDAFEK